MKAQSEIWVGQRWDPRKREALNLRGEEETGIRWVTHCLGPGEMREAVILWGPTGLLREALRVRAYLELKKEVRAEN